MAVRRSPCIAAASVSAAALLFCGCADPTPPPTRAAKAVPAPNAALVGAAASGSWSPVFSWPIVASHASVLPDGRVISWVSSDVPGDTENHDVYVWDPATGVFT